MRSRARRSAVGDELEKFAKRKLEEAYCWNYAHAVCAKWSLSSVTIIQEVCPERLGSEVEQSVSQALRLGETQHQANVHLLPPPSTAPQESEINQHAGKVHEELERLALVVQMLSAWRRSFGENYSAFDRFPLGKLE